MLLATGLHPDPLVEFKCSQIRSSSKRGGTGKGEGRKGEGERGKRRGEENRRWEGKYEEGFDPSTNGRDGRPCLSADIWSAGARS